MRHTIFGESHGPAIGVVLEDLPSGVELNLDQIAFEMARRAPGRNPMSTARKESDIPQILSGLYEGKTTGTPLCAVIYNENAHSGDYASLKDIPRPGHADYSGRVRYGGCNDPRGGGHFSGRLTAPLVFAGAVAKQILASHGIFVGAHILKLGEGRDPSFVSETDRLSPELFHELASMSVPALQDSVVMEQSILAAKAQCDSIGGVIECAVLGVPAGIGSPDFGENVEGIIASHMFAIPAVKGVSFGLGDACAECLGSEYNDAFRMRNGKVETKTNWNGGVNGGITNGMPVVFSVTMRPTPSIAKPQQTLDLRTGEETTLEIKGRHDPCVVQRAVPVVEAATALAVCQLLEGVIRL